jgi:hypothetical protein
MRRVILGAIFNAVSPQEAVGRNQGDTLVDCNGYTGFPVRCEIEIIPKVITINMN